MASASVRHMIHRDIPACVEIDYEHAALSWLEPDFHEAITAPRRVGMVAEVDDKIVGFMVYEMHEDHLTLLKLVGVPGSGAYRALGSRLAANPGLVAGKRTYIDSCPEDVDVAFQLRLSAMGFKAVGTMPIQTPRGEERTGYLMRWAAVAAVEKGKNP